MNLTYLKNAHQFRTIIDIGANDGAFGAYLQRFFEAEKVIAFEPQAKHRPELESRGFEVHTVAVSDKSGTASLSVTEADSASSLLPVADVTKAEWGELVSVVGAEDVRTELLDNCIDGKFDDELLIKIDAQGFETEIIDGGKATFGRASCVLVEVSFLPIYDGQGLFNDVHQRLDQLGFRLSGFRSQHDSAADGRPLFAHAVYEKH
ncbi:FkbM family methyltransferase [Henriciella barbarensis]|uniref:FkbM family methyltransferase n=1 Tax=Henriciella barbarensis TaxID=86342 RepID=A0A399QXX9_9PROT|nr:FkbM family methyltransferase [Henriciella barbarensis]RIJ23768.1 FkbM family methyltransferase [Henriciella barbarensis]